MAVTVVAGHPAVVFVVLKSVRVFEVAFVRPCGMGSGEAKTVDEVSRASRRETGKNFISGVQS